MLYTVYENILLGSYAVYKYIDKKILRGTVKKIQYDLAIQCTSVYAIITYYSCILFS